MRPPEGRAPSEAGVPFSRRARAPLHIEAPKGVDSPFPTTLSTNRPHASPSSTGPFATTDPSEDRGSDGRLLETAVAMVGSGHVRWRWSGLLETALWRWSGLRETALWRWSDRET